MKERILDIIYSSFAQWSDNPAVVCGPGCASCCTANVTITALEGRRIASFCRKKKPAGWLKNRLAAGKGGSRPTQTTNDYVAAILADQPTPAEPEASGAPCPFLEEALCGIYDVRPFSCRCFASTTVCKAGGAATVDDHHLFGAMAVMQIIEHLGQFEEWGNMLEVLARCEHPEGGQESSDLSRSRLLQAKPLPGFAVPEEQEAKVGRLLESIFAARVGGRSVYDILNGGRS